MLVDALHATLEDGERAFHGVRVDSAVIAINVAAEAVEHRAGLGKLASDLLVHLGFVGHQASFAADVAEHDTIDLPSAELVEGEGAHRAAGAVNRGEDAQLVSVAALGLLNALLLTDVGSSTSTAPPPEPNGARSPSAWLHGCGERGTPRSCSGPQGCG
jgi:hypothetical protein